MTPDELATREAVRDLVARYMWAGDRGRTQELAALFLVDGVLDVGDDGGAWTGRDEIAAQLDAVVARVAAGGRPQPLHHHVSSLVIDVVSATEARASSYFVVIGPDGPDHWGRYRDELAVDPADGSWRFARRGVRTDGWSPSSRVVRRSG